MSRDCIKTRLIELLNADKMSAINDLFALAILTARVVKQKESNLGMPCDLELRKKVKSRTCTSS